MSKETYESWSRALAFALKLIGVLGIVFVPVFWAFTNRIELALIPAFGTIAGVGQYIDIIKENSSNKGGPSDDS